MIKIKSDDLFFALSFLNGICAQDNHIPILEYVKMSFTENAVTLSAKDIGKLGVITIPVEEYTDTPDFIVPLGVLLKHVSVFKADSDLIALRFNQKTATLSIWDTENGKNTIKSGEDVEHFPLAVEPGDNRTPVQPLDLVSLLGLGAFADRGKEVFKHVHIVSQGGVLSGEATNSFCGGYDEIQAKNLGDYDVAVSATIERPLKKMLGIASEDEVWQISIAENILYVIGEYWYIGYNLLNGKYPSLANVYRNSNINHIVLDKASLRLKLDKVGLGIADNKLIFDIKDGKITLSGYGATKHTIQEEFPGEPDNRIVISLYNLNKVISKLKSNTVCFRIGTPREPLLITECDRVYFIILWSK